VEPGRGAGNRAPSAKRRGEAEQKRAPPRAKKTRQLIKDPGFAERPRIPRSISGSDDENFSTNLVHQVVAAQSPDYSAPDEQVAAMAFCAIDGTLPRLSCTGRSSRPRACLL
jgi:hypothetical protein